MSSLNEDTCEQLRKAIRMYLAYMLMEFDLQGLYVDMDFYSADVDLGEGVKSYTIRGIQTGMNADVEYIISVSSSEEEDLDGIDIAVDSTLLKFYRL